MKKLFGIRVLGLCWVLLACSFTLTAQPALQIKNGTFQLRSPSSRESADTTYYFYHAGDVLSAEEKSSLRQSGVELLFALKDYIYWVRITNRPDPALMERMFVADDSHKLGISSDNRSAIKSLRLSIAPGLPVSTIYSWAAENNITLLDTRALAYGIVDVKADPSLLLFILGTPWVAFVEEIPQDEAFNFRTFDAERGWGLVSPLTRGLNGEGITIGIGDGGRLGIHEDLASDVLDLASFGVSGHAMQVTGIVTGAGLFDPVFGRGYAPAAKVLVRNFSDILWDAPQYMQDFNLTLTNNSYGANPMDCAYMGDYTGTSMALDAMMAAHPNLLHIFASGNAGTLTCTPFPFRFATIQGGYQPSKNVLTVGAINVLDGNAVFSSRGPVDDGRIKPEVVAQGLGRFSTIDNNLYISNSGTSFSSPAVTGLAALLSQRYAQLHQDSLPAAALIKNVICNGADDMGSIGPDFIYGFGRINGVRSVEILEDGHYQSYALQHAQITTKTLQVPVNVASVDIMLSWSDFPSAPYETVTLVNDLDLKVITPLGDTLRPWILQATPTGVTLPATTGVDRFNNIEQITIPSPVAGTYTILVSGYHIPMGPQQAWLSWDLHMQGITVQSPDAGEIFRPGNPNVGTDKHYIRWDAYGTGNSMFTVDYSTDDGNNWTMIANSIPFERRYQEWFLPNISTDKLRVRVTATNGMTAVSSLPSTIMSPPANVAATSPCDGYIQVSWNAVAGAAKYFIYSLSDETLHLLDSTSGTSIVLDGFNPAFTGWITVAGVFPSGKTGMRAKAVAAHASGGPTCTWDHDLRLEAMTSPMSGRKFTSTELTDNEAIEIILSNAGTMAASAFQVSYQVNSDPIVTEMFPGNILPGATAPFTFLNTADFSASGEYQIKIWLTFPLDPFSKNDTLPLVIRHLSNDAIVLPWVEDFNSWPDMVIDSSALGLMPSQQWDIDMTPGARMRTYAGDPFSYSGSRAYTVDAIRNTQETGATTITLHLGDYNIMQHDVRLSLLYMHHHLSPDATDEIIEVRGSDTDPFLPLITLTDDPHTRGQWQHITGLEISDLLANAAQDYSSSFQLRFPFSVSATAGSTTEQDGQTMDDLSLQLVGYDLRMDSLIWPTAISCGLAHEQISVRISNTTSKPVQQASVSYRLNNGTIWNTEVGTVPGNTSVVVLLDPLADFSAHGIYELEVWTTALSDLFNYNDTLRTTLLHSPLISEYPYREGFETGSGDWLTGGINVSWEHGAPSKEILSHAAEGDKAWATNLTSPHNADEESYLYSPCFDLSGLEDPYLSFAFKYSLEANYDFAWVEYRLENSMQWIKLGTQGSGTNWYNHASHSWTDTIFSWTTTGISLPFTDTILQLRWVFMSDVGVESQGVAIDQINLYDGKSVYTGSDNQWTIPVSGNDWIHLNEADQRIFSIHPQGQDLGDVTVALYTSGNNFLSGDSLYLMKRHWVITSSLPLNMPIRMRGFFTHTEANGMVNATGCNQCVNSKDAFDVAALRYDGVNEDAHYYNNIPAGVTSYHKDSTDVYPNENGYYAEWTTHILSEWWISSVVTRKRGNLIRQISQGSDDAEEHAFSGSVNPVRDTLSLTQKDGYQKVGWRFKNISIPSDRYITSARIELTASEHENDSASWILQSEISPDAATFTTRTYQLSQRSLSDVTTPWSPTAWMDGMIYTSPELRHLIQQVIDQPSWVTGNDLALLLTGTGLRDAWSFDGDPLKAASLLITYDSACLETGIMYVKEDASGNQDGTSWNNAFRTLEQALEKKQHCPGITEIWISGGLYRPYHLVPRTAHYRVPPGVSLYGGFAGNESSIEERVSGLHPTFISGDIGIPGNPADNLYHVMTIMPGTSQVRLDDLTILAGNANGMAPEDQKGGGIINHGQLLCRDVILLNNSSPALYNAPGANLEAAGFVEIRL